MADGEEAASTEDGTPGSKGAVKVGKKQVKNEHVLIIIGVLTLIITYVFLKRSASGNTASNTSTAAPTAAPYASDYSGMADDLQEMQQEIAGLQSGYSTGTALQTPVATSTTPGTNYAPVPVNDNQPIGTQTLANEVSQGAGYWGGSQANSAPVQTAGGQVYDYLPSWAQAQQDIAEDVPVFYQSSPGTFTSATQPNGQLAPALTQPGLAPTPLYT